MNVFDDILDNLPNGFHDALLKSVFVNYEADEIVLSLDVCVGTPDDPILERRDEYKPGKLEFFGIQFFISEAPNRTSIFQNEAKPMIDIEGIETLPDNLRPNLPTVNRNDFFAVWVYLNNFNSFLYICAQSAKFTFNDKDN